MLRSQWLSIGRSSWFLLEYAGILARLRRGLCPHFLDRWAKHSVSFSTVSELSCLGNEGLTFSRFTTLIHISHDFPIPQTSMTSDEISIDIMKRAINHRWSVPYCRKTLYLIFVAPINPPPRIKEQYMEWNKIKNQLQNLNWKLCTNL